MQCLRDFSMRWGEHPGGLSLHQNTLHRPLPRAFPDRRSCIPAARCEGNITARELLLSKLSYSSKILPYGNTARKAMKYTSTQVGELVRETRTGLGLTQESLAMAAGIGLRFIIDLEKGKPT